MTRDQVENFVSGPERDGWFRTPDINVYVRKSRRLPQGEEARCFDVANITVTTQRIGIFTEWFEMLKDVLPAHGIQYIFIESVLTPHFARTLRRWGGLENGHSSFYFKLEQPKRSQ